jgi:hypothetical protein
VGDKKDKKRGKKKLEIKKETLQELSDEQLGDVAGGATVTCAGEGVQQDAKRTRYCTAIPE